ncbi:MAG TPA: alpha/beta hydrolase [Gaiellaceae bacterium]|nr:alpha/beta hydrolase [Gaiellaceae bacterium]
MQLFRTADGRTLAYRREGSGPALVCHPGGPGFSSRYLGDLAGLGERFTLILLDPRGTGGSERPADPRAYTTEDYVADLDELREHLGLDRMLLLGHSHGGVVAAAYAAAHPGRVEKLILASTLARFADEHQQAMRRAMEARAAEPWYEDAREALEREQAGDFADDSELQDLVAREMPFYFARYGPEERRFVEWLGEERPNKDALDLFNTQILDAFDLRPDLPRITAPTLVITGELDFITGPTCAADFAAIPTQRTVLIEGCGHFVLHEARDRLREEVCAFLDG